MDPNVLFVTMIASLLAYAFTPFFTNDVIDFMIEVEGHFLNLPGGSNRMDIQWETISDFLYNALWGIPQGFIGPTLIRESINRATTISCFFRVTIFCLYFVIYLLNYLSLHIYNELRVYIFALFFCVISNYIC